MSSATLHPVAPITIDTPPVRATAASQLNTSDATSLRELVGGLVGNIVGNNLTLIDPATRNATTWGKWSPEWLNARPSWSDDRGLRALELLSYLAAAEEVTGDVAFRATAEQLRAPPHAEKGAATPSPPLLVSNLLCTLFPPLPDHCCTHFPTLRPSRATAA